MFLPPPTSFSWRRNGKYFNVARDSQVSMRRRSGTLDIYAWNNPEQYEAEYQCIASNEYGSAYSNKIRLQLYSKITAEAPRATDHHWHQIHNGPSVQSGTHIFLSPARHSAVMVFQRSLSADWIWYLLCVCVLLPISHFHIFDMLKEIKCSNILKYYTLNVFLLVITGC